MPLEAAGISVSAEEAEKIMIGIITRDHVSDLDLKAVHDIYATLQHCFWVIRQVKINASVLKI